MSTTSTTSRPLPRPLRLVSSGNSSSGSGLPTPLSAKGAPLSAPLCLGGNEFDVSKSRSNPRRQSSISYNTGSSKARTSGLGRSNSVGGKAREVERGDENRSPRTPTLPGVREAEPVTLAEKHADLLRFIAQKESKCLELRTQLSQHEADLLLLKRKWERIVSKGSPSSAKPEGDMLGGIREGVQNGLDKVLAALEPTPAASLTAQSQVLPPKHTRYSQQPTMSTASKRASISTTSSSSTRDWSSPSGSGSSAGSLFDDLAGVDRMSSASSAEGDGQSPDSDKDKASAVSPRPTKAFKRTSSSFMQSPSIPQCEDEDTLRVDDDPSGKERRSRPSSVNLSTQLSSPLSASLSPTLGKQMSNWVPGLNKKWEELKGNETISKQSKRASILLNDVLTALSQPSPSPSTLTPTSMTAGKYVLKHAPSHTTLDSAFFDPVTAAGIGAGSGSGAGPTRKSPSLLDDEDDYAQVGDVLKPEVKLPVIRASKNDAAAELDEEWNW